MRAKTRVEEVMNRNPVLLAPSQSLDQVWQLFCEHRISGAPVVNDERVLLGVLSQVDLLRQAFAGQFLDFPESTYCLGIPYDQTSMATPTPDPLKNRLVEEAMHQGAIAVTEADSVGDAIACMQKHLVHRLIVVDDQSSRHVVGILTAFDLLKLVAE